MLGVRVEVCVADAVRECWCGARSWRSATGTLLSVAIVLVVVMSLFVPVGVRPGVILRPGDAAVAWRMGVARGVLWYRRESPPLFRGQQLAWEPTLLGDDPFGPWHRNLPWWKVMGGERQSSMSVAEWSVPVWPLGVVALGLLVWRTQATWRRRWRVKHGRCAACGYAVGVGGVCPECGSKR